MLKRCAPTIVRAYRNISRFQAVIATVLAVFFLVLFWIVDIFPEHDNPAASRTLGITVAMVILWVTKVVPMGVTALLPAVLFPLTGVMSGSQTAGQYINQQSMVFIGGFILALAMERWNLHKRIALKTMLVFGSSLALMFVSFTLVTFFLSMWISNTATTLIMITNAIGIVTRLETVIGVNDVQPFAIALYLGIAFSSSIGGIGTIVGTPTNLLFIQIFTKLFPKAPEISFIRWLLFALPCSFVLLLFMLLYFHLLYVRRTSKSLNQWLAARQRTQYSRRDEEEVIEDVQLPSYSPEASLSFKEFFREEYGKLGRIKFEEIVILIMFALLAVLWITRASIGPIPGWAQLFPVAQYIGDGIPAVLIGILLFLFPARNTPPNDANTNETTKMQPHKPLPVSSTTNLLSPEQPSSSTYDTPLRQRAVAHDQDYDTDSMHNMGTPTEEPLASEVVAAKPNSSTNIMDWDFMRNFPWEIIILFGGGFALAEGFSASGLSAIVGQKLSMFQDWSNVVLLIGICTITTFLTEVTSNMVIAQIFIPIVGAMSVKIGVCPLYLMVPVAISCSFAFMLPIATAPNMIVFVTNRVTVKQMASTGLLLNIAAIGITTVFSLLLLPIVYEFDINTLPDWALPTNNTLSVAAAL